MKMREEESMFKSELNHEEQHELLFRQGYTDAEVKEILDEAARLQAAAADRTDSEMLLQSAEEAGISREFVEEAMRRLAARRKQQALQQRSQETLGQAGKLKWAVVGSLLVAAFFVALLVVVFYFRSGP
jgi:hypothetical protein